MLLRTIGSVVEDCRYSNGPVTADGCLMHAMVSVCMDELNGRCESKGILGATADAVSGELAMEGSVTLYLLCRYDGRSRAPELGIGWSSMAESGSGWAIEAVASFGPICGSVPTGYPVSAGSL